MFKNVTFVNFEWAEKAGEVGASRGPVSRDPFRALTDWT